MNVPPNQPIRLPRLLTEGEAADALGVSVDTVRRERKAGKIRHTVIGGRVRYTENHLVAYIEAGERGACTASAISGSAKSEAIGSPSAQTAQLGAAPGSMSEPDRRVVHRSARMIFSKRSSSLPHG
jgi:excisionase family DNA binding protein